MLVASAVTGTPRILCFTSVLMVACLLGLVSCSSPRPTVRSRSVDADEGWPMPYLPWQETRVVPASWSERTQFWSPASLEMLQVALPQVEGAEFVRMDEFCATCHETYVRAFANNVHREQDCESCHGAASRHLANRGTEGDSILSFSSLEAGSMAGRILTPAERSEICLQCHEDAERNPDSPCGPGATWRTSVHAHEQVACDDCHRAHYNVPPGTPSVDSLTHQKPPYEPPLPVRLTAHQDLQPEVEGSLRGTSQNLNAVEPDDCYACHENTRRMEQIVHPHQIGVPFDFECTQCHREVPRRAPYEVPNHPEEFNCSTCHDPHGNILAETRKDLCLQCHDNAHMNTWQSSVHNAANVACTDCHNPHSPNGPPMHVDEPQTCYRCHAEQQELEQIAHPHQVGGVMGFRCTTCHNPHGRIEQFARKDLCLKCHNGSPTMAWHSSTHDQHDVACTDCHNPHPKRELSRVVTVSHTTVRRPERLPMSVDEPGTCYKCHEKIYGLASLPSHHPINEGKMACSSCHDSHGQNKGNLKSETVNGVCFECHAEKEGPFAYEHPPATEDCSHCHNPHGAVANNMLHQPTTFLCLRCHSGHSVHSTEGLMPQCMRCHFVHDDITNVGGGPLDPNSPTTPTTRQALFTDCTQCHAQVHGSDLPYGMECLNKGIR